MCSFHSTDIDDSLLAGLLSDSDDEEEKAKSKPRTVIRARSTAGAGKATSSSNGKPVTSKHEMVVEDEEEVNHDLPPLPSSASSNIATPVNRILVEKKPPSAASRPKPALKSAKDKEDDNDLLSGLGLGDMAPAKKKNPLTGGKVEKEVKSEFQGSPGHSATVCTLPTATHLPPVREKWKMGEEKSVLSSSPLHSAGTAPRSNPADGVHFGTYLPTTSIFEPPSSKPKSIPTIKRAGVKPILSSPSSSSSSSPSTSPPTPKKSVRFSTTVEFSDGVTRSKSAMASQEQVPAGTPDPKSPLSTTTSAPANNGNGVENGSHATPVSVRENGFNPVPVNNHTPAQTDTTKPASQSEGRSTSLSSREYEPSLFGGGEPPTRQRRRQHLFSSSSSAVSLFEDPLLASEIRKTATPTSMSPTHKPKLAVSQAAVAEPADPEGKKTGDLRSDHSPSHNPKPEQGKTLDFLIKQSPSHEKNSTHGETLDFLSEQSTSLEKKPTRGNPKALEFLTEQGPTIGQPAITDSDDSNFRKKTQDFATKQSPLCNASSASSNQPLLSSAIMEEQEMASTRNSFIRQQGDGAGTVHQPSAPPIQEKKKLPERKQALSDWSPQHQPHHISQSLNEEEVRELRTLVSQLQERQRELERELAEQKVK